MSLAFFMPLLVIDASREKTLHDIDEAIEFLNAWPLSERDPMWASALRSCEFARDRLIGVPSARRLVETWARQNDILGSWVTRSRRVPTRRPL